MPSKVTAKAQLAAAHTKNIAAFFRQQKLLVMRALNHRTLSALPARALEAPPFTISVEEWIKIWSNVVRQTDAQLKAVIAAAEVDGLHAGASNFKAAVKGPIPASGTFDLANPRAVAWFQQNGGSVDYIKGIQDTTGRQIKTIIESAITEGKSYGEVATGIRGAFDGMSRDRAETIATYEIGNAYEEGNMQFAQSLKDDGVVMVKQWNCDSNPCDVCRANQDEGLIPIDQPHQSGDDQPQAHPHCYCWETYEQAQGD